jgi:hypothetical protein
MSNTAAEKKEVRPNTAISNRSHGLSKKEKENFTWLISHHDPADATHKNKISVCGYCLALQSYWKQYWGEA